jgi:hypothetical protein
MVIFLADLLLGCQARQIRLRLPVGEIALLLAEIHFGDGLLDGGGCFHLVPNWREVIASFL